MRDEIIVQGRLSFSLLRMHALSPKWFNFYGFKSEEVPDVQAITSAGEIAEENAYLGRLLISARVNKVESMAALQLPAVIRGGPCEEPPSKVENFLIDLFEVSGVAGSEVMVEMSVGTKSKKTKTALRSKESDEDPTTPGRFLFQGDKGRMTPLVSVIPTNASEQLDVILSLFSRTTGYVTNAEWQRVGFARLKVVEIRDWDGDTQTPLWCAMSNMAHLPSSVEPGALLCSLAKSSDTVLQRGVPNCKPVKFNLRCYLSMARNLQCEGSQVPSAFCEVSCAGQRQRTKVVPQTSSPSWADMLELDISLQCSLQNMRCYPEPIQLTVYDVVGKSLLDKVADAADTAKQLAAGAMAGDISIKDKLEFNDEAGLSSDIDVAKMGEEYAAYMKDQAMANMLGDVMAAKRLGEVKGGRRVIGRQKIHFRRLLHPLGSNKMRQRWLKLRGGVMATGWAGDIMIGLEMMRVKYVKDFPPRDLKPPGKPCLVSVAVIGLRNLNTEQIQLTGDPVLEVVVPSVKATNPEKDPLQAQAAKEGKGAKGAAKGAPKAAAGAVKGEPFEMSRWMKPCGDLVNRKIYDDAMLPKLPVYEPDLRFRLRDNADPDSDTVFAEGRIGMAEHLPWVQDAEKARKATEASDLYSDGEDGTANDGMPVSDADEEGSNYVEITLANQPAKIAFNAEDKMTFPPIIASCSDKSQAAAKGVGPGDWLISVKKKEEEQQPTVTWSPAKAMEFIETTDKEKIRPLKLTFRKKDKVEIAVRVMKGPHNLELANSKDEMPPKIMKDLSQDKMWRKQGVSPGWRVVDINGFDTTEMTAVMPRFKQLLQLRPAIVTCRPHGLAARGDSDRAIQEAKPVMLSGVASKVYKEHDHKLRHRDGPLAFMRVPRPSAVLPSGVNTQHLNCRPARAACLDVQGLARFIAGGEEEDDKARPSVQGCLEDNMPPAVFRNIPLFSGELEVGQVKAKFKVISPPNRKWTTAKGATSDDKVFFNEKFLRKRFKIDQPHSLRVRTYIIRGLNVSGVTRLQCCKRQVGQKLCKWKFLFMSRSVDEVRHRMWNGPQAHRLKSLEQLSQSVPDVPKMTCWCKSLIAGAVLAERSRRAKNSPVPEEKRPWELLGVPLTPDFVAVGLAYFAQDQKGTNCAILGTTLEYSRGFLLLASASRKRYWPWIMKPLWGFIVALSERTLCEQDKRWLGLAGWWPVEITKEAELDRREAIGYRLQQAQWWLKPWHFTSVAKASRMAPKKRPASKGASPAKRKKGVDEGATGLAYMTSFEQAVLAEYVWLDAKQVPRSKTMTMTTLPTSVEGLRVWNYDGSSTEQAEGHNSEIYLYPKAIFKDPFRGSPHILVLAEAYNAWDGQPAIGNTRAECEKIMDKYEYLDPWFGIEQEYTLMRPGKVGEDPKIPLGFNDDGSEPAPQGPYYTGAGPDVISYTTVIRACERATAWRKSVQLLDDMVVATVQPNMITYSNLVGPALSQAGCDKRTRRST
ncbi:unnamed protein product [Effrenium voratum]|nr:unnamed protein product [Effrenium voratum]